MSDLASHPISDLLKAAGNGEQEAAERLWDVIYSELHRLAARKMDRLPPGQTLQPTAIVNEVYLLLGGSKNGPWENRAHFFGAAARAMRNILVDRARKYARVKHGADYRRVPLSGIVVAHQGGSVDLLVLDHSLNRLSRKDPRMVDIVMLRFFSGLTIAETATTLGISTATVEREWSYAKAWLLRDMTDDGRKPGSGNAR